MPRRPPGSREWLIHQLAADQLWYWRDILGYESTLPQDLYPLFRSLSLPELRKRAADTKPQGRGRPREGSIYPSLSAKVDNVRTRNKGLSVRSACEIVARAHGVSAEMLRKTHRKLSKHPN